MGVIVSTSVLTWSKEVPDSLNCHRFDHAVVPLLSLGNRMKVEQDRSFYSPSDQMSKIYWSPHCWSQFAMRRIVHRGSFYLSSSVMLIGDTPNWRTCGNALGLSVFLRKDGHSQTMPRYVCFGPKHKTQGITANSIPVLALPRGRKRKAGHGARSAHSVCVRNIKKRLPLAQ